MHIRLIHIAPLLYFPSIDFFSDLINVDNFLIESFENYQKQTLRNRCQILTSQGIQDLSIPILHSESKFIRDIKIDHQQRWSDIHWRSIQTAYGKSPFFEYYFEDIKQLILSKEHFIFDFNLKILTKCLYMLKIKTEISFTQQFIKPESELNITDFRNKYLPITSKNVLIKNPDKKYYQSFGNEFVAGLSILDLIFNEGTNSKQILYK